MKEIRQREKELKITQVQWFAAWMLSWIRKRKKIDNHELQSLHDVLKRGGDKVSEEFEEKFQEVAVEGKKAKTTSTIHYTDSINDKLPEGEYTEEELETLYMGTPSKARKRFQRRRSFQKRQRFN